MEIDYQIESSRPKPLHGANKSTNPKLQVQALGSKDQVQYSIFQIQITRPKVPDPSLDAARNTSNPQ